MKLLSYGLDHRMEPRLAFSLNGFAVDVMRASLWMKSNRGAQDFLTLPSSMRLLLEDWTRNQHLLQELIKALKGQDLGSMTTHGRPVAMEESDIVFFPPVPDPPTLRHFQTFQPKASRQFHFGNAQTLYGHGQALAVQGLTPLPEIGMITARPDSAKRPEVAGFCGVNNWMAPQARGQSGSELGVATSMGPYLVTADQLKDHEFRMGLRMDVEITGANGPGLSGSFAEMDLGFSDMLKLAENTAIKAGDVFCSGSPFDMEILSKLETPIKIDFEGLGILNTPN